MSSTFLDLQDERQAVITALLECDAFPAGMELFPAADEDAWTLIQRVIDESDYYLLVIGGKYGSIDPEADISYTEKEYDYAVRIGKPVMAFLHGAPDELSVKDAEIEDDKREKLEAFRTKVEASKHVKYWTSSDGLAGAVALSFNKFVRQYPAVGWIRADLGTDSESIRELEKARRHVSELERQLEQVRTAPPAGIEDLQQGADVHELDVLVHTRYRKTTGYARNRDIWLATDITWDGIMRCFGPRLLQEAEENELRLALGEWLRTYHFSELVKEAQAELEAIDDEYDRLAAMEIEVAMDDFGTVLVQLMALGLVEKSDRKRSVSDTGTYWKLTAYGETRTIQLRALRKDPEPAPTDDEILDLDDLGELVDEDEDS